MAERETRWTETSDGVFRNISGGEKKKITSFLKQIGAEKMYGKPGPRAKSIGERRETWHIGNQPFFIHTDPIYKQPNKFRIQLICSTFHHNMLLFNIVLPQTKPAISLRVPIY